MATNKELEINKRLISTNYEQGRIDSIKMVVMHTTVGNGSPYNWFNNPQARASAHYWVGLDGTVEQYVEDENTAWHASDVYINAQAIGIEHDDGGKPYEPRTDALYEASAQLLAKLHKEHGISLNYVDDASQKWTWGVRPHRNFAKTECPAGLDVSRIVRRANEIVNPVVPPVDACATEKAKIVELEQTIKTKDNAIMALTVRVTELQTKLNDIQSILTNTESKYKLEVEESNRQISFLTTQARELSVQLEQAKSQLALAQVSIPVSPITPQEAQSVVSGDVNPQMFNRGLNAILEFVKNIFKKN